MSEGSLSPIIVKYEKILEEDPRSRSFAPLAEAYRQVGLVNKAFDILKKGLRYNPEYLHGYLTLALCYVDMKEYSLAYSTLRPLVANNRDNLKLQRVFAECAKNTNNLEEALDSYKYMLFLNPREKEIALQVSLLEEDLHEEAVYAKEESPNFNVDNLSPNPEDDKEIDNWVQYDLAIQPKHEEDEEANQWSVGKIDDPPSELSFDKKELESEESEYGDNILDLGRKSLEEAQEAMEPVITHTLVDIYLKQGHYHKAREILEQIMEIGPKSEIALEKLEKINKSIAADGQEKAEVESEGRENLMAAFDKSVGSSIFDDDASRAHPNYSSGLIGEVDLVLNDYLKEIKDKQKSNNP